MLVAVNLTAEQAISYLQDKLGGIKSYKDSHPNQCDPYPFLFWHYNHLVLRGNYCVGLGYYKFRICKAESRVSKKGNLVADFIGEPICVPVKEIDAFISRYTNVSNFCLEFRVDYH
jgi:hypothetical protein